VNIQSVCGIIEQEKYVKYHSVAYVERLDHAQYDDFRMNNYFKKSTP